MTSITLRQRTLIGLAAIALSLGGTLEIASAATTSSTRNLADLTSTQLVETNTPPELSASTQESELVALKFKKRGGFKVKKHRRRRFKKHHDHKKYHGHKIKKHHGLFGHTLIKKY